MCPPFLPLNPEMSGSAIEIINESSDSVRSKDSGQSSAQHGGHSGEGASSNPSTDLNLERIMTRDDMDE